MDAAGPEGARPRRLSDEGLSVNERWRKPETSDVALARRFVAHLRQNQDLLPAGSRVLVALSGGLDSLVLLHLLLAHETDLCVQVTAAHFDHRMREGSRADARWTRALCRELRIHFLTAAASQALRSESDARAERYRFLRRAARRVDASRIVTGHHADDQIETLVFRLARGTGMRGMRGIPRRRGCLVRPLLPFRRAELEEYAASVGIEAREDPSNRDRRFARNRLRHDLLPRLSAMDPELPRRLLETAASAELAEAAWNGVLERLASRVVLHESEASIELARPVLLSYHPHITARLLRVVCRRVGCVPGRAGTRAALAFISSGCSGRAISLAGGWRLEREFDRLCVRRASVSGATGVEDRPLLIETLAGEGSAWVGGRRLLVRWGSLAEEATPDQAALASSALRLPLELRGWRPGERIALPCGTKKMKKLLAERRVGVRARRRAAVLVDAEGRVLWVAGVVRRAGVEPVPGESVFRITVRDAELH